MDMAFLATQLEKGLKLLGGLPDGVERQRQELDLQIALGNALIATKGYSAPKSPCSLEMVNTSSADRSVVWADFSPSIDQSPYQAWVSAYTRV